MRINPIEWARQLDQAIWAPDGAPLPDWKRRAVRVARLVRVLARDVLDGALPLWTMSLVYTTLLSMVPLLALSFSVLKAFGVHNQIQPFLGALLEPLGPQGAEVTERIVGFIERMNVGVLGAVGLALLIYTVISLMQKVEEAFNEIWHVTHLRGLGERFTRYLSALLVGPLLVFAALGITAAALNSEAAKAVLEIEPLGSIVLAVSAVLPYFFVIGAFTFLYLFVPNTRVQVVPALIGGVVAGVLWQSAGWAFASFVASSTRYAAIYSSFAILVLFMIWLYVSWLVLLTGAAVTFYVQNPEYLYAKRGEPRLSNRMRERLALAIVASIGERFATGQPPYTLEALTRHLGIPMHAINAVLDALVANGILTCNHEDPPGYLPARDLSRVTVADLLAIARRAGEDGFLNPASLSLSPSVESAVERIEGAMAAAMGDRSLRSLFAGPDETRAASSPSPSATDHPGTRPGTRPAAAPEDRLEDAGPAR